MLRYAPMQVSVLAKNTHYIKFTIYARKARRKYLSRVIRPRGRTRRGCSTNLEHVLQFMDELEVINQGHWCMGAKYQP